MRSAGVEAFKYRSARDTEGGVNVGVFAPSVFGASRPRSYETWYCFASRQRIEVVPGGYFKRDQFLFPREQFLVQGALPSPAA